MNKEQFQHEDDGAAGHRHLKQAGSEPCRRNAYHQRHRTSCRTLGGVDDGREGHDRQSDVRDVVQERLDELVFDGLPDEGQRQDADGVGYCEHHCDVKPVAADHCSASSLWVLTGNNSAPAQEIATVRIYYNFNSIFKNHILKRQFPCNFLQVGSAWHHGKLLIRWLAHCQIYNKIGNHSKNHCDSKADEIGMDQLINSIIGKACHYSHRHGCQKRIQVCASPWIFVLHILFHRPLVQQTHDYRINNHCHYNSVYTKVSCKQQDCHGNHIHYQSNCCIDHGDIGLSDSLQHTIGNIGISIENDGNDTKHHQLSCCSLCSRKQKSCDRAGKNCTQIKKCLK